MINMKRGLLLIILIIYLIPLVSADVIWPGTETIHVYNKITNINNFPEYTFFNIGGMPGNNQIGIIRENEDILSAWRQSAVSVYAVKNEDFNESYLHITTINQSKELGKYISSSKVKEVIKNVITSEVDSSWNTKRVITHYYQIDINNVKTAPDKVVIERDYSKILFPFILTFLIELVIVFIFIRKSFWKMALYVFLINLITWPIANSFIAPDINFYTILIIEAGVILVESVLIMILFKKRYFKSLLISLVANTISALIGYCLLLYII